MAHLAITVEGGLFAADLLEKLGATPHDVTGQRGPDFGLERGRTSDEIQSAFSDARAYWEAFKRRRAHSHESLTTQTRESWVIPLLERLGHDVRYQRAAVQLGRMSYPISHRAGDDPEAPPVHIIAADRALDRRASGMRQSPHAMVQDYLNRTDPLWGILTNGKRLRLLRDTARLARPTYIEFDLEAMVEGNLYSEFVLFYRLVHRTRLPRGAEDAYDCLLEAYYQQGIDEGGRVREHLREGVEAALETLGTGFLAHPESAPLRQALADGRLDALGFYRQLLRLIYRLLFLMTAEERHLLLVSEADKSARQDVYTRWYSVASLRERAERRVFDDPHGDLWEGLKQTFRLFRDDETAARLGLTALDGELFGPLACRELELAGLYNAVLLQAVFRLSTFEDSPGRGRRGVRRRVNYAGLDVEEFGSVYESLLDFHPRITLEPPRFELVKGSERKTTGSYYTHPDLVRALIHSALDPVIEDRLAKAETKANPDKAKEAALLSLKVCDPAAGSGHFLLAAARRIARALARVRTGEAEPAPGEYRRAVRDVVRHCLYAVDKNPLAVDLCKVALWIEGHETGMPLSFLDHRVKCGDSLVGVFDLAVLAEGIPDAAYKAVAGDDKAVAAEIKRRNRLERKNRLFRFSADRDVKVLSDSLTELAAIAETTPGHVQAKEARYKALREGDGRWRRDKMAADLWTAAFFAPLTRDAARPVPTTADVWNCLGERGGDQGPRVAGAVDLAAAHRFFHWPLEFPEVFAQGGFDVMLGNPPWEVSQLSEKEFFAVHAPKIAELSGAARKTVIAQLETKDPAVWALYRSSKHEFDAVNEFHRGSGRNNLTTHGKLNTYAIFAETFLNAVGGDGRAGVIVPTGIATDNSTKAFFDEIVSKRRLASLFDFENREAIFAEVHRSYKFCLLTLANDVPEIAFLFFATRTEHLVDARRRFTLSPEDIALINPNTRTCPVFRSRADAALTRKIYERVPVLIDEAKGADGNPWGITFRQGLFNMTSDSGLFRTARQLTAAGAVRDGTDWRDGEGGVWRPLFEAKMIHQYDHRWATYDAAGEKSRDVTEAEKRDTAYASQPRYWVPAREVDQRLRAKGWTRGWLMGWRDITNATNERTVIAVAFPRAGVGNSLPLMLFPEEVGPRALCSLAANLSSITLDFVARHKVGGTHLNFFIAYQLPVLPPSTYSDADLSFIVPRVLELTHTAEDMRPFAEDLGHDGPPFTWDPDRRAALKAELDAYYAYLYGLTRDELRYILDPADVFGDDYPSETFRVLKKNEIRAFGEYRTHRLVLAAWDRFAEDGTFAPERLRAPDQVDRIADLLAETKGRLAATEQQLAEVEAHYRALLARADAQPLPALFVEGATDVTIVEAAWRVFFPGEALPAAVLAAGGTTQMGSLAGKGRALRRILDDRLVCALADNDSEGRALWKDGHFRKGGRWRRHENGIHWCLLAPSADFTRAMERLDVPKDNRPFTVEACFPAALRRRALAEGAYGFSGKLQSELVATPDLAQRMLAAVQEIDESDDAYFYLMAPTPEAKVAFAQWVTRPERLTRETYAAFESVITGLRALLSAAEGQPDADIDPTEQTG